MANHINGLKCARNKKKKSVNLRLICKQTQRIELNVNGIALCTHLRHITERKASVERTVEFGVVLVTWPSH